MAVALLLHKDGRIHSGSTVLPNGNYNGMPIVNTLPDGNLPDYLYVNGMYIYDPLPIPELIEPDSPAENPSVWDELDAAYQEGYDEGYQKGVNSAYDQ